MAPVNSVGSVTAPSSELNITQPTSATAKKNVSTYDPNAAGSTQLSGPAGALSGSSITLSPWSLSIAANLVVEESVPLSETSVAASLNLRSDLTVTPVGAGLIIRPTSDVDLTKPLLISMPLGVGSGLRSLALDNGKHYAVFYKYFVKGELLAGVIPSTSLTLNEKGQVLFEGYFGAYWLCETNFAIEVKGEVKTAEPIVNGDHVSVIESGGYVPETLVAAKAGIPEVKWHGILMEADATKRTVTLKASLDASDKLNNCQVDLSESADSKI
ncbi:MAG: hypothetical protein AAB834_07905, partial [Patescibacteria group bacterium]